MERFWGPSAAVVDAGLPLPSASRSAQTSLRRPKDALLLRDYNTGPANHVGGQRQHVCPPRRSVSRQWLPFHILIDMSIPYLRSQSCAFFYTTCAGLRGRLTAVHPGYQAGGDPGCPRPCCLDTRGAEDSRRSCLTRREVLSERWQVLYPGGPGWRRRCCSGRG